MAKYIDAEPIIATLRIMAKGRKEQAHGNPFEAVYAGAIAGIANAIDKLPAADIEPRWIPVTERLPGREGMYLVTSLDGGLHVETTKWFFTTFDGGFFLCDLERNSVVAWMPLPEPYKGGEEK